MGKLDIDTKQIPYYTPNARETAPISALRSHD